jgi:hypothetical protein
MMDLEVANLKKMIRGVSVTPIVSNVRVWSTPLRKSLNKNGELHESASDPYRTFFATVASFPEATRQLPVGLVGSVVPATFDALFRIPILLSLNSTLGGH